MLLMSSLPTIVRLMNTLLRGDLSELVFYKCLSNKLILLRKNRRLLSLLVLQIISYLSIEVLVRVKRLSIVLNRAGLLIGVLGRYEVFFLRLRQWSVVLIFEVFRSVYLIHHLSLLIVVKLVTHWRAFLHAVCAIVV
jgi:hypothetical protein